MRNRDRNVLDLDAVVEPQCVEPTQRVFLKHSNPNRSLRIIEADSVRVGERGCEHGAKRSELRRNVNVNVKKNSREASERSEFIDTGSAVTQMCRPRWHCGAGHHRVEMNRKRDFAPVLPLLLRIQRHEAPRASKPFSGTLKMVGPRQISRPRSVEDRCRTPGVPGAAIIRQFRQMEQQFWYRTHSKHQASGEIWDQDVGAICTAIVLGAIIRSDSIGGL